MKGKPRGTDTPSHFIRLVMWAAIDGKMMSDELLDRVNTLKPDLTERRIRTAIRKLAGRGELKYHYERDRAYPIHRTPKMMKLEDAPEPTVEVNPKKQTGLMPMMRELLIESGGVMQSGVLFDTLLSRGFKRSAIVQAMCMLRAQKEIRYRSSRKTPYEIKMSANAILDAPDKPSAVTKAVNALTGTKNGNGHAAPPIRGGGILVDGTKVMLYADGRQIAGTPQMVKDLASLFAVFR